MTNSRLPIRVSGVLYERPVGKRLELAEDGGSLVRTALLAERSRAGGVLNLSFGSAKEAFQFRLTATANYMLFTGTFSPELQDGAVVPKGALHAALRHFEPGDAPNILAATAEQLAFRDGPSLLAIDVDVKDPAECAGFWPSAAPRLLSCDDVRAAVLRVLPEASEAPMLVTASASSMIEQATSGTTLRGPGGWRVVIPVADATQIPRVLSVIHQRCWARDIFNYAFVSKGGRVLIRSLADLTLGRPTQPDYPAADLGEGLRKVAGHSRVYSADGPYLDGESVVLSLGERERASVRMHTAKQTLRPAAEAARETVEIEIIQELSSAGVPKDRAATSVAARFAGLLLGSDVVTFEDGAVTVAQLLTEEGQSCDGKTCFDPVEPGYDGGRAVAIFFWNDGLGPRIHSFAHGSTTYLLAHDPKTARLAVDAARGDAERVATVLANTAAEPIEYAQLEQLAGKLLGLGNRRKEIREQVDAKRRRIGRLRPFRDPGDLSIGATVTDLQTPLKKGFPVVDHKQRPLDHLENIAFLLDRYGFSYRYNVIKKDFEWEHLEVAATGDNAGELLYATLVGLCALNDVPRQNLIAHLTALGDRRSYNPVLEYLSALVWDGSDRFNHLADAMDCDDPVVARIAIRIFFIQACAAADHSASATKADPRVRPAYESVLVLVGRQGIGKTKGMRTLFPAELRRYFKEGVVLDIRNKDLLKAALSSFACELGELDGTFKKMDIANLKAFLSLERDEIRAPYAHKASNYARGTVFLASVNDAQFLADETGNRRFMPVVATKVDVGWGDEEIDQVWAEALHRYRHGERWWPSPEEEQLLSKNAERFRSKSEIEEKIADEFDWGMPPLAGKRQTAAHLCDMLLPGRSHDHAMIKSAGNAMRRQWAESGLTELRHGALHIKCDGGSWIKVLAEGGENRGWLAPPRRTARSLAGLAQRAAEAPQAKAKKRVVTPGDPTSPTTRKPASRRKMLARSLRRIG